MENRAHFRTGTLSMRRPDVLLPASPAGHSHHTEMDVAARWVELRPTKSRTDFPLTAMGPPFLSLTVPFNKKMCLLL